MEPSGLSKRLRAVLAERRAGVVLVVENARKENVASIARTAECLGVGELHLIYTPEQVVNTRGFGGMPADVRQAWLSRLSKSATDWLVIEQHESIGECATKLRAAGVDTFVATSPLEDGAVPLYGGDDGSWARGHVALCFGSEGAGLSPAALALADIKLSVPQVGMTQSLNVAACAAIVLAETLRLRGISPTDTTGAVTGSDGNIEHTRASSDGLPRLSTQVQQELEERLMPLGAEAPLRLHNKARAKHAMRQMRKEAGAAQST